MIELAFGKQLPPEDADFLEKVQSEAQKTASDPYSEISRYFFAKYGVEFGRLYLAAITGGVEEYEEAVKEIERQRALKRAKMQSQN